MRAAQQRDAQDRAAQQRDPQDRAADALESPQIFAPTQSPSGSRSAPSRGRARVAAPVVEHRGEEQKDRRRAGSAVPEGGEQGSRRALGARDRRGAAEGPAPATVAAPPRGRSAARTPSAAAPRVRAARGG